MKTVWKVFQEIKVCCFITKSKYQTKAERRRWRRLQKLSWHNQVLIPVKRSALALLSSGQQISVMYRLILSCGFSCCLMSSAFWCFLFCRATTNVCRVYWCFPVSSHTQKLVRTIYYKLRELEATSWNNLDSNIYSALLPYILEDDYLTI